jgi:hypothetical protein
MKTRPTILLALRVTLGFLCVFAPPLARAVDVTACLTADNYYALYRGKSDGSGLTLIGRNELTDSGGSWVEPETWYFAAESGDHIYVVAWNGDPGAGIQCWIGAFSWFDWTVYSDLISWESTPGTGANPFFASPGHQLPDPGLLQHDIANAQWSAPMISAPNGSPEHPWGTIAGVGAALFIWHDSFDNSVWNDHYIIFRTREPVTTGPSEIRLTEPRALGDGRFSFELRAQTGRIYRITSSTDLRDWTAVTSFRCTSTPVTLICPGSASGRQFYRAEVVP